MIVTESLTRGPKYVFNTSQVWRAAAGFAELNLAQASQIAHLIKDYTQLIMQRQGIKAADVMPMAPDLSQPDQ